MDEKRKPGNYWVTLKDGKQVIAEWTNTQDSSSNKDIQIWIVGGVITGGWELEEVGDYIPPPAKKKIRPTGWFFIKLNKPDEEELTNWMIGYWDGRAFWDILDPLGELMDVRKDPRQVCIKHDHEIVEVSEAPIIFPN